VAPWVLNRLRFLAGCHKVLLLLIDVIGATNFWSMTVAFLSCPWSMRELGV
ncbi:unnamed protein product, partial [Musa hybrid cultivar]